MIDSHTYYIILYHNFLKFAVIFYLDKRKATNLYYGEMKIKEIRSNSVRETLKINEDEDFGRGSTCIAKKKNQNVIY